MGKFLIKKVPTGFKFDLKTHTGDTVATSEVYTTKAACIKGIRGVKAAAPQASCADLTQGETAPVPRFEVFQDKKGHFRFRLLARNGRIIASSDAHMTRYGCDRSLDTMRSLATNAVIEELC